MSDLIFQLKNVRKDFTTNQAGGVLTVLKDTLLDIRENEFVCLVGPSGCGKSTLLRIIAGLEPATTGTVLYRDEPHDRPSQAIGMVFQNYSLMPWLNVEDNIGLGLTFKKTASGERKQVVDHYLEIVGLTKFRKAYPHELSGGMQQRVAIARSLANDPDVLLMDEPFGALDAFTRIQLQKELLRIWENDKKTIIFVTHSVDEAVYLADRILLMSRREGAIEHDIRVDMPRIRDRSDPAYANLTQTLLDELEQLNTPVSIQTEP